MKVLNFGSLNVDHVYTVDHISRPGETIPAIHYQIFPGGKGANQSVALARAGAHVFHAGKVGPESQWLRERLSADGIDVEMVKVDDEPGGHAIIQVAENGQNSILIFGGANQRLSNAHIDDAFLRFSAGDILLLQNETNGLERLISSGHRRGMRVCLNPAPMTSAVRDLPLDLVDVLLLNECEGAELAGVDHPEQVIDNLSLRYPRMHICLTIGERGVLYHMAGKTISQTAFSVRSVDTTAAGDTFIGYFLAACEDAASPREALLLAAKAAALSVMKAGAMDSIPHRCQVDRFCP